MTVVNHDKNLPEVLPELILKKVFVMFMSNRRVTKLLLHIDDNTGLFCFYFRTKIKHHMKKHYKTILSGCIIMSVTAFCFNQTALAQCTPASASGILNINNVNTTLLNGGDGWWDLYNPKYEVPKGSGKHSMFAGGLWIGGTDSAGNIKLAAQTYRQIGRAHV